MKRYIIFIMAYLLVISPNKTGATIKGYDMVTKSGKDDISMYAKKIDDLYHDFKIDFKGRIASRPFWMNVTNPTYAPQIFNKPVNPI